MQNLQNIKLSAKYRRNFIIKEIFVRAEQKANMVKTSGT